MVVAVRPQAEQAILTDLDDPLRAGYQPDHQGLAQGFKARGQRQIGKQRHVGGLHPAVGEIDRRRRLGSARHPDEHNFGVLKILAVLPVIVQHAEIERVDALKILGIQRVLGADPRRGLRAQIGLEQTEHGSENRQAGDPEISALVFQAIGELAVEQRIEHDARGRLNLAEHPVKLLVTAHQRVNVLNRRDRQVLGGSGARHRDQRLAGRIGKQMQMKVALRGVRHRGFDLWTDGEQAMAAPFAQVLRADPTPRAHQTMHSHGGGRTPASPPEGLRGRPRPGPGHGRNRLYGPMG